MSRPGIPAFFCLVLVSAPALLHAQAVLLVAPDGQRPRIAAELKAVGARVQSSAAVGSPLTALRALATEHKCAVLIWVAGDLHIASVWATAADGFQTRESLQRTSVESVGTFAIRLAEFVDAWKSGHGARTRTRTRTRTRPQKRPRKDIETTLSPRSAPSPPPSAPPPAPSAPPTIRVGAAIDRDLAGLSGGALLRLAASLPFDRWPTLAIEMLADLPIAVRTVRSDAGETQVAPWLAGLALSWRVARWSRLSAALELGGGVAVTNASAQAAEGYSAADASLTSAAGWSGASARLRIQGRWHARLDASAIVLSPRPMLVADQVSVANWGSPTARLALTLEASL